MHITWPQLFGYHEAYISDGLLFEYYSMSLTILYFAFCPGGGGYRCSEHWQVRAADMGMFFVVIWYAYVSVILVQGTLYG